MENYAYIRICREGEKYFVSCEKIRADPEEIVGLFSCVGQEVFGERHALGLVRSFSREDPYMRILTDDSEGDPLPEFLLGKLIKLRINHNNFVEKNLSKLES